MLISYVLDGKNRHNMDTLRNTFDHKPKSYKELVGTGKNKLILKM